MTKPLSDSIVSPTEITQTQDDNNMQNLEYTNELENVDLPTMTPCDELLQDFQNMNLLA